MLKRLAVNMPLKTCALVGNLADARIAETAVAAYAALRRRGIEVLVARDEPAPELPEARSVARLELAQHVQCLISVGGDGTLLQAARLVAGRDVPLLGINRGRLGFLTDVLPNEINSSIDALVDGRCAADRRPLLEARLLWADGASARLNSLNDVVLLRRETGRMFDFQTTVDKRYLNTHRGDGLVVATATGSTAYALSCGGPIVDPRLDVLVMAPICPHTLSDRPIMVPGDAHIEVKSLERGAALAEVTCDGVRLGDMQPGDRLQVSASGGAITLLHPPGYDYFRLLRSKLHWGRGEDHQER
jgi:NAD+ kinase